MTVATVTARTFTATSLLSKKGKSSSPSSSAAAEQDSRSNSGSGGGGGGGGGGSAAAFDFDAETEKLESEIARIEDRLKNDLSKLRAGQADPATLEGLSVVVDRASGSSVPIRDVAHVVARGRALAVTAYEAAVRLSPSLRPSQQPGTDR